MERRKFLRKGGMAVGAIASAPFFTSCIPDNGETATLGAPPTQKVYNWKAVTTWPPNFPVLGEAMVNIAKELEVMSSGRLKIKVYGAGELVPAFEAFDAVAQGVAQICHGASYYWAGNIPAAVFFASVPFGLNAQQMNSWLLYGGGLELWRELYDQFGLIPFPAGNTGVQMGGWFNKAIEDFKGLKMRIPGLGGKVINKAGGSAITVAGGEIYTNLERGNIDATEWIGPYHDYKMGFHKIAKYYYYPGWHEPGTTLEMFLNKEAYEELPADLQEMVESVTLKYNHLVLSEFEAKNNAFLEKMMDEGVQLKEFPKSVLDSLKKYSTEVIEELIEDDEFGQRIYASFKAFKEESNSWNKTTEGAMAPYL
jgi:TRAP-type mannitol/chloroaromatic compound transport system substrate-binding protein